MSIEARLTTLEQAMAELALVEARTVANMDRRSAEADARIAEANANMDRRLAKLEASIAEVNANMGRRSADVDARIAEVNATMDRRSAELDAKIEQTTANIHLLSAEGREFRAEQRAASKDFDRRLGELSNKMGTLAEDIVAPSIPRLFRELFGVEELTWFVRASCQHPEDRGRHREFDVTAWGGDVLLVNETKSRLRPEDIDPFVSSLPEVREYLPEAERRRIVGAFSSFYVDPTLVKAAERAGLYVFGLGSGLLEVLNTPGFAPRRF